MKTVAIISEYNPFHTGHEYQINCIRKEFGTDTRIIAIMSGNFTQRAETAILDKYTRAECAIRCGVDLVLELPFPYSSSSAEFFSKSGVFVANSLGVVDVLSFGSESGNLNSLTEVASHMTSKSYIDMIRKLMSIPENAGLGYPRLCEIAYKESQNKANDLDLASSNNILAIEYIKALNELNSKIKPHTVKRFGADYSETSILDLEHQSASAIRKASMSGLDSALDYFPNNSRETIFNAINSGAYPCDMERLSSAIISHLRLTKPNEATSIHDAKDGIYNRLYSLSFKTNSLNKLIQLADTKKYTSARLRRAILNSYLGVTSSMVKDIPRYTQVLGMNGVGKGILKEIKKKGSIPIVTKSSAYDFLSIEAKAQKEFSDRADSIFQLTRPTFTPGNVTLTTTPFVAD